jgi:hypothetical protein
MTPLYKSLKSNGTSFYAFPGAAEDISAAYQNQNYRMYFSKYILLNFPKQNLQPGSGTMSKPVYWDFENTADLGYGFVKSNQATPATSYKDQMVESLRNYVANFEVSMKESRLNNTEYYYDNNVLDTPTEKIFWKWCKSLNLIDFEQALDGDEYFGNLLEFQTANANDTSYFPEILWREREVQSYDIVRIYQSPYVPIYGRMEMEFSNTTNFKIGDVLKISDFTDSTLIFKFGTSSTVRVLDIIDADTNFGQRAVVDFQYLDGTVETSGNSIGKAEIVYHRLVQYIGEVNGINNVQDKTRSYTEVYALVADHTGRTPDILFRTKTDKNYKPGLAFPILPAQYQPEIVGAELFNNPIVSTPQNYPGSYFGQFDTIDYTYELSSGDSVRRSGEYYGISGDIDNFIVNPSNIDGLSIDFDTTHYVKMNFRDRVLTNFEQFNSLMVNNLPPQDFEFNAILWYYTVEDLKGNQTNNLYGISILDNPDNNTNPEELFDGNGLRIPLYKKLAANDNQDGISYAFSLNLNFSIINDNPQDTFNPEAINSLYSFNLFNEAMTNLAKMNESFTNIISNQNKVETDLLNLKQLLYNQTDLQLINGRIKNLESLLNLYSTNQILSSDSIRVTSDTTQSPPMVVLETRNTDYHQVVEVMTRNLYNNTGNIPYTINIPDNKNLLIHVINDDLTNIQLPNEQKLEIILSSDLSYRQSVEIVIDANDTATQNKQLDVYVNYKFGDSTPVETKLMETIELPVYYNTITQLSNSAKNWKENNFNIDLARPFILDTGSILKVPMNQNPKLVTNAFTKGDVFMIGDFFVGTQSRLDFSGQYTVNSVDTTGYVYFNISNNPIIETWSDTQNLPVTFNDNNNKYLLSNVPHLRLNKGIKFKITRISESPTSELRDRYFIQRQMY